MKEKTDVVWPVGKASRAPQPLASRLDTLEGKTICGLFNLLVLTQPHPQDVVDLSVGPALGTGLVIYSACRSLALL